MIEETDFETYLYLSNNKFEIILFEITSSSEQEQRRHKRAKMETNVRIRCAVKKFLKINKNISKLLTKFEYAFH